MHLRDRHDKSRGQTVARPARINGDHLRKKFLRERVEESWHAEVPAFICSDAGDRLDVGAPLPITATANAGIGQDIGHWREPTAAFPRCWPPCRATSR